MTEINQIEDIDVQFVTSARALKLDGRFDKALCEEIAKRFGFEEVKSCHFALTISLTQRVLASEVNIAFLMRMSKTVPKYNLKAKAMTNRGRNILHSIDGLSNLVTVAP